MTIGDQITRNIVQVSIVKEFYIAKVVNRKIISNYSSWSLPTDWDHEIT